MSIIHLSHCPVCGSHSLKKLFEATDHFSSGENFPVCECTDCQFRFTNNFPSEDIIGRYYNSPDYISHSDSDKGVVNRLYHHFRKRMLKKKVALVAGAAKHSTLRLVDIGCGTGYFLQTAKERGWSVSGIEKDEKARESATARSGLKVYDEESLWQMEPSSFDVVTLWHALEHMEKLNETIVKIKEIISPEGLIVLALPNCQSFDTKIYTDYWAAYDIPRHLWHFSPDSVTQLFAKHNLTIVKKVRMPLDAFYISLLSEKYKGSNLLIRYGRAFAVGMVGYLKSLVNINQSSSVIYIAKKTDHQPISTK